MNLRTLRLLEYNKIVEMLTSYAASPMAKRKCERLKPRRDLTLIQTLQQETRDALIRLNTQGNLSFAGLRDIGASIKRLEVQGALGIKEPSEFHTESLATSSSPISFSLIFRTSQDKSD